MQVLDDFQGSKGFMDKVRKYHHRLNVPELLLSWATTSDGLRERSDHSLRSVRTIRSMLL